MFEPSELVRLKLSYLLDELGTLYEQARVTMRVEAKVYRQEQEADARLRDADWTDHNQLRELPDSEIRQRMGTAHQIMLDAKKAIEGIEEIFRKNGWRLPQQ